MPDSVVVDQKVLTDSERIRQNDGPDRAFYQDPRFVHHVDERFRERLATLYRQKLGAGTNVLDLMSSWVSHLPEEMGLGRVVGHGMNEEELAANERLTDFFVQDLNTKQRLPLGSEAFGAALCAVSVQYLQHPERVFAEVARTLRPGGTVVVSFSNRMFAQKAVRAWREASGRERCGLVESYLEATGLFGEAEVISESPLVPPTERFLGGAPDPFYAVCARKCA
jgi:SAM-dependent methyltransferase